MVRASSPPKCLDQDGVGRCHTGNRHGNVYRSVREKQGNVVYRQSVLQTVTSLRVVSPSVSRGRPPENRKYEFSARSHTLALEKKLVPRESGGSGARREGKGGEEGASQSTGNFNHPCSAVWVYPGIHQVIGS